MSAEPSTRGVPNPPIATERLVLEPLVPAHADELYAGLQNPRLHDFTDDAPPPDIDWLRDRYERLGTRRSPDGRDLWLNWAVRVGATGACAGFVQASVSGARASIAYVLLEEQWGHGFAREAVRALLDHLRDHEGCTEATAQVDPRNKRSIALLEALEFRRDESRSEGEGEGEGEDLVFRRALRAGGAGY